MAINRRRFLQRSAMTGAALTAQHPLFRAMFGTSVAHAAPPSDAIFVLVQLEGGNDGLDTVFPVDDVPGFPQRSTYLTLRGSLKQDNTSLSIGADPGTGNELALHPALADLWTRFDTDGKLAVIEGVGYPGQSLSHFRSEDIWFGGIPSSAPFSSGWFGRWLDSAFTPSDLVTLDLNETLNPSFFCSSCNVLAVTDLDEFLLPDDPVAEYQDAVAKKLALGTAYGFEADPLETSGVQLTIGTSGKVLLDKVDVYGAVSSWGGSNLSGSGFNFSFARRLKEISSILKFDQDNPGSATGARFFHVRLGGFDTHTNQAVRHVTLLDRVSRVLDAFYQDTVDLGIENKVLTVTMSEFGRRGKENGTPSNAGTDHGRASVLFALGGQVQGGVYGSLPDLTDLDAQGNLKENVDFRQVYATVIDKWLGSPGDHAAILSGGPYTTLGFLP
jgi:uncharacterized protein (DUF1501 family)